jgi:hypothetical protein
MVSVSPLLNIHQKNAGQIQLHNVILLPYQFGKAMAVSVLPVCNTMY